jgi:hypothetical protein
LAEVRRKRQIAREGGGRTDDLLHELSFGRKYLDTPVFPVSDVDRAVARDADSVHDAEILWTGIFNGLRRHDFAMIVIHRLVAEGAPHAFERTAIRIEHDNAVIAVTVGDKQLIRLLAEPHIRSTVNILRVRISLALVAVPDLHDEFAVLGELQQLIVGNRFEARQTIRWTIVSADPNEAFGIDMDSMLTLRPFKTVSRSAPRLHEIAIGVKDHHRWRSHWSLIWFERARTVQKPNIVLRVDGETGSIAQLPFGWNFRPSFIHFESRQGGLGGNRTARKPYFGSTENRENDKHQTNQIFGFHAAHVT